MKKRFFEWLEDNQELCLILIFACLLIVGAIEQADKAPK